MRCIVQAGNWCYKGMMLQKSVYRNMKEGYSKLRAGTSTATAPGVAVSADGSRQGG